MVSTILSHCSSSTTARLLPISRQHGVVYLRRLAVGPLHVGPPSRCSPSTRTLTLHSSTSPSPVLAGTSPLVFPSFLFRFCLVAQKMSKPEKNQNFSYIYIYIPLTLNDFVRFCFYSFGHFVEYVQWITVLVSEITVFVNIFVFRC
jgi:hypothetical protein